MSDLFDIGSMISGGAATTTTTDNNNNSSSSANTNTNTQNIQSAQNTPSRSESTISSAKQPRKLKLKPKTVIIPSLYKLCIQTIASKIERFPPEVFCSLSEQDWEIVVKHRHTVTAPSVSSHANANANTAAAATTTTTTTTTGGGIDGCGRMSPAISDKVMMEIEECNPHLASSKLTDTLIWKDCVQYKFKAYGPTRPKALLCPWTVLVEKLKLATDNIVDLIESSSKEGYENGIRTSDQQILEKALLVLIESPMSVDLLNETKIGKSVSKCLKKISKISSFSSQPCLWDQPMVLHVDPQSSTSTTLYTNKPLLPKAHLEDILNSWKTLASTEGVKITQNPPAAATSSNKANSKTTSTSSSTSTSSQEQQYTKDMKVLKMCFSWRELFEALTERRDYMLESHGAKMREKRQTMEIQKHKVKEVKLKSRSAIIPSRASGNRIRQGGSAMLKPAAAASSSSSGMKASKLNSWKRQVAVSKAGQKGIPVSSSSSSYSAKTSASSRASAFSTAVANATRSTKRKISTAPFGQKKEIVLDGGRGNKRMRMPTRDRDNKFASNQLKSRLKRQAFGDKY